MTTAKLKGDSLQFHVLWILFIGFADSRGSSRGGDRGSSDRGSGDRGDRGSSSDRGSGGGSGYG